MPRHRGRPRTLRRLRSDLADERRVSRALAREAGWLWRELNACRRKMWELDAELDALFATLGVYRPASTALPEERRRTE